MGVARANLRLVEPSQDTLFPDLTVAPPEPEPTALVLRKRTAAAIVAALGDDLLALREAATAAKQKSAARAVLAGIVFAYWAFQFDHPRALLDPRRERRLLARLAECDDNVSDLLWALDGARRDKWTMGEARDSEKRFDDIETILLDRSHVERFGERMKGFRDNLPHPLAAKHGLHHD